MFVLLRHQHRFPLGLGPFYRSPVLWLIHSARDPDRNRETMCFYITLCTVHTTQGQGQVHGTVVTNKVCEGYVFTPVCLFTGGRGSASGGPASYWNAFLFSIVPIPFPVPVPVPTPCSVSEPLISVSVSGSVSALPLISLWSNECHIT